MAIAIAGLAAISSALAPALLKRPLVAPLANHTDETAGTPTVSSISATGVSAATPVAPVDELASEASAQITDPEPAPNESVRPDRTLIASQVSSAAQQEPAANDLKLAAKLEQTAQPSFDLPSISSGSPDTPSPPVPIGAPERQALQRMVESVVASVTRAQASAAVPTGTVVQLGAPSSKAEAKRDLKRLNTKYGSALKGSTVSLRKVLVNGETIYRLRVVGLSRGDAATLCLRVRSDGGSCSVVR